MRRCEYSMCPSVSGENPANIRDVVGQTWIHDRWISLCRQDYSLQNAGRRT